MSGTVDLPFGDEVPATIPLEAPPLANVLVQVRFPNVLSVANEEFVGPFQQAIIERFPRSEANFELGITMGVAGPEGMPGFTNSKTWKFKSADDVWKVSLASSFVALETSVYPGHEEFFEELDRVLAATQAHIRPPFAERIGVRYIQRLDHEDDVNAIATYVRPEILGAATVVAEPAQMQLLLTQSQFALPQESMGVRWGIVPAGVGIDAAIAPIDRVSWVFDIDTFTEQATQSFDAEEIRERAYAMSRRSYRFFRWAVEPAFLLRFGANPDLVAALERGNKS